jgi:hypothetical protein
MSYEIIVKLSFLFFLLSLSAYFIYSAFPAYSRRKMIRMRGQVAQGRIIGYKKFELYEDPNKAYYYRPQLEFTTKEGKKFIVHPEADEEYKYPSDTEFTIYYLEENPKVFYIKELPPYQFKIVPFSIVFIIISIYSIIEIVSKL